MSFFSFGCQLAKHRKSDTLEVKDIQLHLEKNWNIRIPGFGGEEIKPLKKPVLTDAHKQKMLLIKKGWDPRISICWFPPIFLSLTLVFCSLQHHKEKMATRNTDTHPSEQTNFKKNNKILVIDFFLFSFLLLLEIH